MSERIQVSELSREELSKVIYNTLTAKIILKGQDYLAHLEVLKRTPLWNQQIKNTGNRLIELLIKEEKTKFNKLEKAESELPQFKNAIDNAFESSGKALEVLAKCAFIDTNELIEVLLALNMDRNSVLGISRKVLKHKTI